MATDLIEIDSEAPDPEVIARAASSLKKGRVVAIPTDALYTLVADPFNLRAVSRVFLAKGRDSRRSLPLPVSDSIMAEELGRELLDAFLPAGPALLARPADHHRSRVAQAAAAGDGQYGPAGAAAIALGGGERSGRARWVSRRFRPAPIFPASRPAVPASMALRLRDGRVDMVLDGGLCSGEERDHRRR